MLLQKLFSGAFARAYHVQSAKLSVLVDCECASSSPLQVVLLPCLTVVDFCIFFFGRVEKSDIYSFAVFVWEMLARDAPFKQLQNFQVAFQVREHATFDLHVAHHVQLRRLHAGSGKRALCRSECTCFWCVVQRGLFILCCVIAQVGRKGLRLTPPGHTLVSLCLSCILRSVLRPPVSTRAHTRNFNNLQLFARSRAFLVHLLCFYFLNRHHPGASLEAIK